MEERKLRLADNAERFAETEDRIAETMTKMAAMGRPEHRDRRLKTAQHAREVSEHQSIEAEKWRSLYELETRGEGTAKP